MLVELDVPDLHDEGELRRRKALDQAGQEKTASEKARDVAAPCRTARRLATAAIDERTSEKASKKANVDYLTSEYGRFNGMR